MSFKDQKIISSLLEYAKTSKLNQKHAAAVYCGNNILTKHINSSRNKFGKEIRCCSHSEIACLYNLFPYLFKNGKNGKSNTKYKPNKMTIYIVRYLFSGKGNYGSSQPCKNCTNKIKKSGIKKLVYINTEGEIIKTKTKDYYSNFITSGYRVYNNNNLLLNS